jgi:hypothetical protein
VSWEVSLVREFFENWRGEKMKRKSMFFVAIVMLLLAACKGGELPVNLKGGAAFQLADGSPISSASTDEYNPYVVKMSDGYLMLVFGSDRSCGGCTANTHNIFVARSVAAYADDAKLPYFNTPTVLTVGGTPLNLSASAAFAAAASGASLRVFLNNSSAVIQYADLSPAGPTYNVAALGSINNFSFVRSTILGIDASGTKLIVRATAASNIFLFDTTNPASPSYAVGNSNSATGVFQVNAAFSGQGDAFFIVQNATVSAASYSTMGAAHAGVNTVLSTAKVSIRTLTALQTGVQKGELVFLSGYEAGAAKQDLYVLDGTNSAYMWTQMGSKPAAGTGSNVSWTTPSTTATRVYGQFNTFNCAAINNNNTGCTGAGSGVPNAASLESPFQPVVDDTGLYVADQRGNRLVYYPGTATTATKVYGQGAAGNSFTTATTGTANANFFWGNATPRNLPGLWVDASGVYGVDIDGSRILHFPSGSFTADRVYGQGAAGTNFAGTAANSGGILAATLNQPDAVTADATGVYITDTFNNRVLYYPGTSVTATRVYGQFGSFTCGQANNNGACGAGTVSANSLNGPRKVSVADDGVYISDMGNHRVLFFPGTSTTATRVYGQFGSMTCGQNLNNGACAAGTVSANNLDLPWGIKAYSGGLYIADYNNKRVLYFPGTSTTPSAVWGQFGSFTCNVANNNGSCVGGTISANSLGTAPGVEADATGLYIADNGNNRVLFYPRL